MVGVPQSSLKMEMMSKCGAWQMRFCPLAAARHNAILLRPGGSPFFFFIFAARSSEVAHTHTRTRTRTAKKTNEKKQENPKRATKFDPRIGSVSPSSEEFGKGYWVCTGFCDAIIWFSYRVWCRTTERTEDAGDPFMEAGISEAPKENPKERKQQRQRQIQEASWRGRAQIGTKKTGRNEKKTRARTCTDPQKKKERKTERKKVEMDPVIGRFDSLPFALQGLECSDRIGSLLEFSLGLGFTVLLWVRLGCTRFKWVLLGCTGFYWVGLGGALMRLIGLCGAFGLFRRRSCLGLVVDVVIGWFYLIRRPSGQGRRENPAGLCAPFAAALDHWPRCSRCFRHAFRMLYRFLIGFTGFYWVLLGFTGFYCCFLT